MLPHGNFAAKSPIEPSVFFVAKPAENLAIWADDFSQWQIRGDADGKAGGCLSADPGDERVSVP